MYPTGTNNIGTLLRMIQEDQNKNLAALNPSAEPSSPIRGLVQQPLTAPEAPGTSRVVSIRPEGTPSVQGEATPSVVAPVAPTPGIAPTAPIAPVAPGVSPMGGGQPYLARAISPSMPSIGTSIRPLGVNVSAPLASPTRPAGTSVSQPSFSQPNTSYNMPSTSKAGGLTGAIGGLIGGAEKALPKVESLATKILPKALGGTLAGITGGWEAANALLKKFTGGSWAQPRKAY